MGSFALQDTVIAFMVIPPDESSQPDLRFPAITVGQQIHLLILVRSPQSHQKDAELRAKSVGEIPDKYMPGK
jgi:hypothetical protein